MVYWVVRVVLSLLFRLEPRGLENLPKGPAILAANHIHALDPPALAIVLPRVAAFMAKAELFAYPGLQRLFRSLNAFPVHRGRPDRRAIRQAAHYLERDYLLVMFPEGHRSETGDLQAIRKGAAFLARRSQVPVVPVGIVGPYRLFQPVTFQFGPAFTLSEDLPIEDAMAQIHAGIAQQMKLAQRNRGLAG